MAELSRDARALLEAARSADDPTPEQRSRADAAARDALAAYGLAAMPPLDPPGGHATTSVSEATAGKLGSVLGWKLAAGAAALIAAGWFGAGALRQSRAPVARTAPAVQQAQAATATSPAATVVSPHRQGPHSVTLAVAPTPQQRVRSGDVRETSRSATGSRSTGMRVPAPQAPGLEAEVALIASANALLRAQRYGEASKVLATHARRFPRGALREERIALGLLALCGTGQREQARRAIHRFMRTAPRSVVAQRVRAACDAQPEASP